MEPTQVTHPLMSSLLWSIIVFLIVILPFWKIFTKAGFSGLLALLMLVPIVNVILVYFLAFADWPALKKL